MGVRASSRMSVYFNGCVCYIKKSRYLIFGTILRLDMGMGEHDGVGACIKTTLCRKEMKFTNVSIIRDAKSIVELCSSTMGEGVRM